MRSLEMSSPPRRTGPAAGGASPPEVIKAAKTPAANIDLIKEARRIMAESRYTFIVTLIIAADPPLAIDQNEA